MNITSHDSPDSTYWNQTACEPEIRPNGLHLWRGNGTRRAWGTPGTTSTVVVNEADLISVHVGFHHKHGGGQFWRHFKPDADGVWQRLVWKSLTESDQIRVLDAALTIAPAWANNPGKLRSTWKKPNWAKRVERDNAGNIIGYKWLNQTAEGLINSPIKPEAAWYAGCMTADVIPTAENANGIYAAKVQDSPILDEYSRKCTGKPILVQLLLSGAVIESEYGYRAEEAHILTIVKEAKNENR